MNKLSKFLDLASDQNTLMENRDIYSRVHTALLDLAEHGGVVDLVRDSTREI